MYQTVNKKTSKQNFEIDIFYFEGHDPWHTVEVRPAFFLLKQKHIWIGYVRVWLYKFEKLLTSEPSDKRHSILEIFGDKFFTCFFKRCRRGIGALPSARLGLKSGRANLAGGASGLAGDDSSVQDESSLDGEESEK